MTTSNPIQKVGILEFFTAWQLSYFTSIIFFIPFAIPALMPWIYEELPFAPQYYNFIAYMFICFLIWISIYSALCIYFSKIAGYTYSSKKAIEETFLEKWTRATGFAGLDVIILIISIILLIYLIITFNQGVVYVRYQDKIPVYKKTIYSNTCFIPLLLSLVWTFFLLIRRANKSLWDIATHYRWIDENIFSAQEQVTHLGKYETVSYTDFNIKETIEEPRTVEIKRGAISSPIPIQNNFIDLLNNGLKSPDNDLLYIAKQVLKNSHKDFTEQKAKITVSPTDVYWYSKVEEIRSIFNFVDEFEYDDNESVLRSSVRVLSEKKMGIYSKTFFILSLFKLIGINAIAVVSKREAKVGLAFIKLPYNFKNKKEWFNFKDNYYLFSFVDRKMKIAPQQNIFDQAEYSFIEI